MASVAVRSKAVVLLMLIHCLLLLSVLCNHLAGEERAVYFTIIAFSCHMTVNVL